MNTTALRIAQALLMAAVLGVLAYQVVLRQSATRKVLVIHSYNTDLPWVGDVDQGITRALAGAATGMQVRRHYMNLLNHPDCHSFHLAAEDARLAIDDWKPDAVVLVDDLAQALVGFPNLRWNDGAPVAQCARRHRGATHRAALPGQDRGLLRPGQAHAAGPAAPAHLCRRQWRCGALRLPIRHAV